jgi:TonB family protein
MNPWRWTFAISASFVGHAGLLYGSLEASRTVDAPETRRLTAAGDGIPEVRRNGGGDLIRFDVIDSSLGTARTLGEPRALERSAPRRTPTPSGAEPREVPFPVRDNLPNDGVSRSRPSPLSVDSTAGAAAPVAATAASAAAAGDSNFTTSEATAPGSVNGRTNVVSGTTAGRANQPGHSIASLGTGDPHAPLSAEVPGGGGASGNAGAGAGANESEVSKLVRDRLVAAAQRCYPQAARRFGHRGVVGVSFCLDGAGSLARAEIVQPSGSVLLDAATRDCVIPGARPFPSEAGGKCFHVPVRFGM